jgi:hypothetical protein
MLFGWLVLIVLLVALLIRKGTRNTGLDRAMLLNRNMEDIQAHNDRVAARNGGRIGGFMAPLPVPSSAAGVPAKSA